MNWLGYCKGVSEHFLVRLVVGHVVGSVEVVRGSVGGVPVAEGAVRRVLYEGLVGVGAGAAPRHDGGGDWETAVVTNQPGPEPDSGGTEEMLRKGEITKVSLTGAFVLSPGLRRGWRGL